LTTSNNKAKVRRLTRPGVLGTAKVMSCEDLKKARADRSAKDEAKAVRTSGKKHLTRAQAALMTEANPVHEPVQDPAGDLMTWTSEVQEHAINLMAWMARNTRAGEGHRDGDGRGS
jgi:hypothetical protein